MWCWYRFLPSTLFFWVTGEGSGVSGTSPEVSRLEQLYEKRDLYYSSIKDIELDRDMGKLSEQDYTELVSRYKEKAAAVTKLISELQSAAGDEKITGEARTSPFEAPLS